MPSKAKAEDKKGEAPSKLDILRSRLDKATIPLQNAIKKHSKVILIGLFVASNLILIGFSSALLGLLNHNYHCDIVVEIARVDPHPKFFFNPDFWVNTENVYFDYDGIFNGTIALEDFSHERISFWAILTAVSAVVLISSVIAPLTLGIFLVTKANNKVAQKAAHFLSKLPKIVIFARNIAFFGAVIQILVFCCMIALLMAALLQAGFADSFASEAAVYLNRTLHGIIPTLEEDVTEALSAEPASRCWASVYTFVDEEPITRFGVVLLAVAAFVLTSIFTSAALMERNAPSNDEQPLVFEIAEENIHDNGGFQDDHSAAQRSSSKDIEMTRNDQGYYSTA